MIAIDSSGQDRKEAGHSFAEEHFINFKDILLTNQVFFVSHSEGCAFATGMAQYFVKNNINVVESVLLSCDEGDEFEIDFKLVCYQIECMYWETYRRGPVFIPRFDWIINTNLKKGGVKGVTKFGVVINNNLDALSIHGKGIVVPEIFSDIADLKEVQVLEKIKKNGGVYFEQTLKRAKFYQINDKVILSNHPDWNRIRKQSVNI